MGIDDSGFAFAVDQRGRQRGRHDLSAVGQPLAAPTGDAVVDEYLVVQLGHDLNPTRGQHDWRIIEARVKGVR
jgi:hypothetical protein